MGDVVTWMMSDGRSICTRGQNFFVVGKEGHGNNEKLQLIRTEMVFVLDFSSYENAVKSIET